MIKSEFRGEPYMSISICTFDEIINLLLNKKYDKFKFTNTYAIVYTDDAEILFEINNGSISNELAELAISVFKNLDEYIKKAYKWLQNFNLKNDRWHSNALDEGVELYGIYFGKYGYGHQQKPLTDGFTISFKAKNDYPCIFTVKFRENMHPFAIEEWVN